MSNNNDISNNGKIDKLISSINEIKNLINFKHEETKKEINTFRNDLQSQINNIDNRLKKIEGMNINIGNQNNQKMLQTNAPLNNHNNIVPNPPLNNKSDNNIIESDNNESEKDNSSQKNASNTI